MIDFTLQLTSISEIKRFVNIACTQSFDITIFGGRYAVDAKSIMAVFSLDLSKPLRAEAECGKVEGENFLKAVKDFIVEDTAAIV